MFKAFQRLALFVVGFSLPIQGYSFLDFAFGMTPFKVATALLLLVGLVQLAASRRRFAPDRKRWWMGIFLVTFLIACVSSVGAGTEAWVVVIIGSTYVSLVIYYFLIGYVVQTRNDLVVLLWGLLLGGAITAAPAVLGLQQGAELGYGERFKGLAGQENVLGFDMAMCLPVGLALLFGSRTTFRRGLAIALSLACVAGLLLSLSRSAFVSLAVMSVAWMFRSGRADSVKYLLPVLGLGIGLFLLAPESVVERIDTMVNPARRAADGSIQSRFFQWELSLRAIASSPLIGLGVMRFMPWADQQPGSFGFANEVHNAYLGIAVDQGLIGALAYIAIMVLTWGDYSRCTRLVRARRQRGDADLLELGHYAVFLQIALLGGAIGGLFGMAQKSKTLWLILALSPVLLSMARARIQQLEPEAEPEAGLVPFGFHPDRAALRQRLERVSAGPPFAG